MTTIQEVFTVYAICTTFAYIVFILVSLIGADRTKREVNALKRRVETLEVALSGRQERAINQ